MRIQTACLMLSLLLSLPVIGYAGEQETPPQPDTARFPACLTQEYLQQQDPGFRACDIYGDCDIPATRDLSIPAPDKPFQIIRTYIQVLANDDGSNPATNLATITAQMASLNAIYEPYRLRFIWEWRIVNSTHFRNLDQLVGGESNQMKAALAYQTDRYLNIYVTNTNPQGGTGIFAFFPTALGPLGGVVADDSWFYGGGKLLVHEIGHVLGLFHTQHGVSEVPVCGPCYESPGSADRDYTGDFCSDTDPTPINFNCSPPGGNDECTDLPWGPTMIQNYMGYANEACQSEFSPQQSGRMHCWIAARLSGWLECEAVVPSNGTATANDPDMDSWGNASDNCPSNYNPCQQDLDSDGSGDACDTDIDGDIVVNSADNCPLVVNADQVDSDGDLIGDACDNCLMLANASQPDFDSDGAGDLCDSCTDSDGDGFANPGFAASTCPIDNCPGEANLTQADTDSDAIGDACDNCPTVVNVDQFDENHDGTGDACDGQLHVQAYEIPDAIRGEEYLYQFTAVGGTAPYIWQFFGGDIPFGMDFIDGQLFGTSTVVGIYFFTIKCFDSSNPQKSDTFGATVAVVNPEFICGDADGSFVVTISDAVFLINYIFSGGPAPQPSYSGDADCSGVITISDAVYLINYIFAGGGAPCSACL